MSTPTEALAIIVEDPDQDHAMQMGEIMGAARLADEMVKQLSSQAMRVLQAFRDEKGYLAYGHKNFDDFLDNHPRSPMTRHQFYDREKLLGIEGDGGFNALNAMRMPISKRKLLANGDVEVNGDEMKVGEQTFDLADKTGIVMAINLLASERAVDRRTIERGKKEIEVKKRKIGELEETLSHGGMAVDGTAHARALVATLGDHAVLNQEIVKIEDEAERQRFGLEAMERLAQARLELEESLGFTAPVEE